MILSAKIKQYISVNGNQFFRIIAVSAGILFILLLPERYLFNPDNSICIHHRLLGFECPLCGTTRGIYQLIHFRIKSVVEFNPVVLMLPAYFIADVVSFAKPSETLINIRKTLFYFILAGFLLVYLYRIAENFV